MIKFTRDNAAFPGAESIFDYGVSTLGHGVTIAGFSGLIDRDGGLGSEQ